MDKDTTVKVKNSLKTSWKEGIAAQVMLTVMDYYLIPFGLFLGATAPQIGLLIAFQNLLGAASQIFAVHMVWIAGSRLRFLVKASLVQGALLLPIALLALITGDWRIPALIALMVVFRIIGNWIGSAWGSLVSDYLPPERRGHYFGFRSQVTGVAGVLTIICAGLLLHFMKKISLGTGFFILFIFAAVCRFISSALMARMYDLPHPHVPDSDFTFVMFLRRFRESNFVRFVLYVAAITFAANLSGPYMSVYMLRDRHLDYLSYMTVHLATVTASLVAFPIWGRHADLVGNARILKMTSFLIPIIPFLWVAAPNVYCMAAAELVAGFVWGGFNLCAINFIFDAVSPQKRVRCLAYFNMINGSALFAGAALGGFLSEHLPPFRGSAILTLAIISGVLRFMVHGLLSEGFKEVRESTRKVAHSRLFFSVLGLRPLVGSGQDMYDFPLIQERKKVS